jgi:PAS domain S-box-containing protein
MHYLYVVAILVAVAIIGGAIFILRKKISFRLANKTASGGLAGKDEKQQLEVIFNSIDDGVILVDDQGVINLFNPGASTITGWTAKDAKGIDVKTVIKLVDDKGQLYEESFNPFAKVFKVGQTVRDNKAHLLTRSNKQISLSVSVFPLVGQNDKVTSAVAIIRDVEGEKQEEARQADFISTASHEMRTPVAAIEGYLALALNNKVATIDNRARDYLEKAHSSTQHLGTLFQDLLTSAKAEDGRMTSHPKVIEIGAFLRQLTEDLRFGAEKRGLHSEFVLGSGKLIKATKGEKEIIPLYYVNVDPDRLREVVTNIFDNAVKYTPAGKITIGLTGDNQVVQFYIRDTGPGIDSEDVPHLFQKFYRVDNSATRTIGGTGLGLFICRKIVELYNGRIWVESELGKGSSFYINLPRLSTEQITALSQANSSVSVPPSGSLTTS